MVQKREPPPRAILESERLLSMHISQDQKVPNVKFLIRAAAIALNELGKRLACLVGSGESTPWWFDSEQVV
jgi:hypothetical protein